MPTRLNPTQMQRTRDAIRTSQLANRLQMFVLGEHCYTSNQPVELSPAQVTAALGLLRKTLPDLVATEHSGEITQRYVVRAPMPVESAKEWLDRYSPTPPMLTDT